jgi:hypothetical protein
MSAFARHGRAMQVDDDALDADGGGGNNKALQQRLNNNDVDQNNRNNYSNCNNHGYRNGDGGGLVMLTTLPLINSLKQLFKLRPRDNHARECMSMERRSCRG